MASTGLSNSVWGSCLWHIEVTSTKDKRDKRQYEHCSWYKRNWHFRKQETPSSYHEYHNILPLFLVSSLQAQHCLVFFSHQTNPLVLQTLTCWGRFSLKSGQLHLSASLHRLQGLTPSNPRWTSRHPTRHPTHHPQLLRSHTHAHLKQSILYRSCTSRQNIYWISPTITIFICNCAYTNNLGLQPAVWYRATFI